MKADCQRWTALEDRRAVGERLSEAEETFCAKHARECKECSRESKFWQNLQGADVDGEPAGRGDATGAIVERIIARHERSLVEAGPPVLSEPRLGTRRLKLAATAAGAFALAAAVTLLLHRGNERSVASVALARARVSSGDAEIDGRSVRAGDAFLAGETIRARGRVCLDVELGVRACLDAGSEVGFESATPANRVLALRRGHLSAGLAHQPAGTNFSVSTPKGTATAVGTSFSVDVPDPAGPVRVRVEKGIVAVVGWGGATVRVHAHEETVMGTSVVTRSAVEADERIPAEPLAADKWDDHDSPVVETRPPADASVAQPAPSLPPDVTVPSPPPSSPPIGASAERSPRAASADDLLQRARVLRGEGRFGEAANVYRELQATHPKSAEGHASLVSLGEIELSQLGDPARALRSFDEYLATGGVLAEEAEYDRIGALGALGRDGEKRRAIEAFVARYPSSLRTPTLRIQSRLPPEDAAP